MSRAGGGNVFKSASTGVLRPRGQRDPEELDPLQAVLNHTWNRPANADDGRKRGLGIAQRRGLQAEMSSLDKASSSKAGDKSKADDGRSRIGQAGSNLFVDTTGAKSRFAPAFEESGSPAPDGGEFSPASPGDDTKKSRRGQAKVQAAPVRKYQNEVCPEQLGSPRLRSPPGNRKGQVKLDFENDAKNADDEHAQAEVDDHKPHLDPEHQHFINLVHHFHGACNQAGIRLNDMLTKIRKHFLEDSSWLENKLNYDQLTEIGFEVQTANYFIAKWHHDLEPRKVPAPVRPSKIEDMSAEDILAQCLYSISRMEVLASALSPVLEKICHDARTMRRGPNGEPLTPTSKNALLLAKKRGFVHNDEFNKFMGHMEHILAVTQHLATPPESGLPKMSVKNAATVFMAASKFKRGLKGFKKPAAAAAAGAAGAEGSKTAAGSAISGAFKNLTAAVNKEAESVAAEKAPAVQQEADQAPKAESS